MNVIAVYAMVFLLGLATPLAGLRVLSAQKTGESGCFLDGVLVMLVLLMLFLLFMALAG